MGRGVEPSEAAAEALTRASSWSPEPELDHTPAEAMPLDEADFHVPRLEATHLAELRAAHNWPALVAALEHGFSDPAVLSATFAPPPAEGMDLDVSVAALGSLGRRARSCFAAANASRCLSPDRIDSRWNGGVGGY